MKLKIHYTIDDFEDFLILEGDNIEEIRDKLPEGMDKRGLDQFKNDMWSEEI